MKTCIYLPQTLRSRTGFSASISMSNCNCILHHCSECFLACHSVVLSAAVMRQRSLSTHEKLVVFFQPDMYCYVRFKRGNTQPSFLILRLPWELVNKTITVSFFIYHAGLFLYPCKPAGYL